MEGACEVEVRGTSFTEARFDALEAREARVAVVVEGVESARGMPVEAVVDEEGGGRDAREVLQARTAR